ncbi:MAG: NADH dehydrogenase subunit E [Promethearchaeota archaeon]|nr:MAG: NADH dehydrogenase subunit E [Candidatus Lokiarchaeota archaeon]
MTQNIEYKLKEQDRRELKKILDQFNYDKNNLISILQTIQDVFGFLPRNSMFYLAKKLQVPAAEIYGVSTFYTQFKFDKLGKNHLIFCDGTACHLRNREILGLVETLLGIKPGETTSDMQFSYEIVACLGCCAISPVCMVNGEIYGNLTTNKVKKLIKKLRKQ